MGVRRVFVYFVLAIVSGLASSAVITFAAAGDLRLVTAAKNRDFSTVQSLIKQRLDVNASDIDGMTPLHWAAHWDEFEIVKQLLAACSHAKAGIRYGVTPLHEAALVADVLMMEALLKAGANADV